LPLENSRLEAGSHFTQDEDRFFFQGVQVAVVDFRQQLLHIIHSFNLLFGIQFW
jgi:hypothetical protein